MAAIKHWRYSESLESAHAERQQTLAARLVKRKVTPLKDQDIDALRSGDDSHCESSGTSASDHKVPRFARAVRYISGRVTVSHHWIRPSISPLQENQLTAEARSHRKQYSVLPGSRHPGFEKVGSHE